MEESALRVHTKAGVRRYVAQGGARCFCCGSDSIEGGSFEAEAGGAWQEVRCCVCGAAWQDIYRLVDAVPLEGR